MRFIGSFDFFMCANLHNIHDNAKKYRRKFKKKESPEKIAAAIPRGSDINYILYNQLKSVSVFLYCLERNRLFDISLAVFYLQDDVALLLAALYDDYEFAREEFHLWLGERFERCGIAVAGCLESAGTTHLEGQFVIGKRTFIAVLILQTHGDEGKIVASAFKSTLCSSVQPSTMQATAHDQVFLRRTSSVQARRQYASRPHQPFRHTGCK